MTSAQLKKLRWLDREIAYLEEELDHGELVCEKSVERWATQAKGSVPPGLFVGAKEAAERTCVRLQNRLDSVTQERDTLIAWIDAISKADTRAVIYLHYAKGYTWREIADQYFGGAVTVWAVRKMCGRYIRGEHQGKRGRSSAHGKHA